MDVLGPAVTETTMVSGVLLEILPLTGDNDARKSVPDGPRVWTPSPLDFRPAGGGVVNGFPARPFSGPASGPLAARRETMDGAKARRRGCGREGPKGNPFGQNRKKKEETKR